MTSILLSLPQEKKISRLSALYRYMLTCRGSYLLGTLYLLGTNCFALLIPWLMKLAVEALRAPATGERSPGWYAGLIIAAAIAQGGIRICSRTTLLHAARRIEYTIREDLYRRLISLDLSFFARARTGDIMSRFSNDLTNVRMLTGFGILNIVNTIIVYVAAVLLMMRISPLLTLWAILPFPLMILVVKKLSASMFRRSLRAQEELARLTSRVEENVSAASLVRAYCLEETEEKRFAAASGSYFDSNLAMARLRGLMIPVMATAGASGTLIVLFAGGRSVINGAITLGDFVAFNGYLAMLVWPTIIMGWILNLMQRGAASMERLSYILEAESAVEEPADPVEMPGIKGEIEIRNLRFAYPEKEHLFRGLSLKVPAGSRAGFIGPVGSGKSTLMKLIPRLYPVERGEIFIDGTDINDIATGALRRCVSFVPQDSFLFSRTISDNILYGRNGADREELEQAARLARLDREIEAFPAGYGTRVGERGLTLSGGQKQRAAIARALIKNAPVLILDDPLSAVDARTENEILERLSGYYRNRTVLIVSHRLSALRDCDMIFVLDDGRIVEQGQHEELLELNGRYAAIHREQQLRAEIERI